LARLKSDPEKLREELAGLLGREKSEVQLPRFVGEPAE
jgi:hypothetical protein